MLPSLQLKTNLLYEIDMKRILTLLFAVLALAFALTLTTQCERDPLNFEYAFNIDGHATGDVLVTFPGGDLNLEGSSKLGFNYASVPPSKFFSYPMPVYTVDSLSNSSKRHYRKLAKVVDSDYDSKFTASSASGTYYLHITGMVKEYFTGIEIKIDKVLTNEE